MSQRSQAMESFLSRLAFMGERLRTDSESLVAVASDASHAEPGHAAALLSPRTTDEVSRICREAQHLGIGLVPRGAGTGKAGGAIPSAGQVVVDVSGMASLKTMAADDLYAVVQPGMTPAALDAAAAEHGLMYPPDPASWQSCSLGGNIATNAGGPRAVKYGVTERYVWGLEVVLAGGDVLRVGRHSLKGVAGYNLTGLFVGSEGTLGIITEATLHLIPAPRGVQTAWLTFATPQAASRAADRIFAAGMVPRMLELIDPMALAAVRPLAQWPMPPGLTALLVEADAADDAAAYTALLALCDAAAADHAVIANSESDREHMRRSRRQVSAALKNEFPFKVSDDIAVPRSQMPALLHAAQSYAQQAGLLACAYGHLGDGNLHVNVLCKTAEERQRAAAVQAAMWQFAVAAGGTITGEHGIGLCKREALGIEQPEALLAWQRRLKACFDPQGLMNPGKVLTPHTSA